MSSDALAREATTLLYRCGQAVDECDWDSFTACFAPDATFDLPRTGRHEDRAAMVRAVVGVRSKLRQTQHLITNPIVTVGEDGIGSSCYVLAQHCRVFDGIEVQYLFGGRYTDAMRVVGDTVTIAERRLEILWTQGDPTVLTAA